MQRVYFILISLFLVSCAKQRPKGILSEKDMSALMTEVSLIDAYLNTLPIDSGRKVMPVLYAEALGKYSLDSTAFVTNLDYYLGNPLLTEKIYDEISTTLSTKEKAFRVEDSILNVVTQDSIRREMRIRMQTEIMKELISNVHLDTTEYTYVMYGEEFLAKNELNLMAYGIQVPVIVSEKVESVPDSSMHKNKELVEVHVDSTVVAKPLDTKDVKQVQRKEIN